MITNLSSTPVAIFWKMAVLIPVLDTIHVPLPCAQVSRSTGGSIANVQRSSGRPAKGYGDGGKVMVLLGPQKQTLTSNEL